MHSWEKRNGVRSHLCDLLKIPHEKRLHLVVVYDVKRVKNPNGKGTIKRSKLLLINNKSNEVVYESPIHDFGTPEFYLGVEDFMSLGALLSEDIKSKQNGIHTGK